MHRRCGLCVCNLARIKGAVAVRVAEKDTPRMGAQGMGFRKTGIALGVQSIVVIIFTCLNVQLRDVAFRTEPQVLAVAYYTQYNVLLRLYPFDFVLRVFRVKHVQPPAESAQP